MANVSKTVEIIFSGINRASGALGDIADDIDAVGNKASGAFGSIAQGAQSVEAIADPIANAAQSLVKLEAAALATGAAFVTFATVQAGQFATSFAEIATLIGEDPANLEQFKDDIAAYAATSTQSLDTITGAVYSAISAGIDYEDSLQALSVAEKLSVAGKAELQGTLVTLVSTLNAYGLSTENAALFSDLLFTTVKEGQTTLPELQASLANVTAIAATANVPFEEITAAIATLTAGGTQTSAAITGITATISSLIKPSKEAQEEAEKLGINFTAAGLSSQGLASILGEVADKTGGSTEQIAKLFGGVEALKAVLPLTGSLADTFADKIDAMGNAAGSTEQAYNIMADNLDLQFQKLSNSFRSILLATGDPLIDEFAGIADAISTIFVSVGESISEGALESLVAYTEANLQDLEAVFDAIAANLPEALDSADLSGFTEGIDAVKDAIGDLFEDVDLTTPEGLRSVIEGLGTAFQALGEFTGGFISSFEALVDFIVENKDTIGGVGADFAENAGALGGFATQASAAAGALGGLAGSLEILIDLLIVRTGANLALGLGRSAAALGGASGLVALLGPAGLVAAAGGAGYAIGSLIEENTGLGKSIGGWLYDVINGKNELQGLSSTAIQAQAPISGLKGSFNASADGAGDLADRFLELTGVADLFPDAVNDGNRALYGFQEAAEIAADEAKYLEQVELAIIETKEKDKALQEKRNEIANEFSGTLRGLVPIYDDLTGRITGFDKTQRLANESVASGAEAILDAEGNIIGYTDGIQGIGTAFKEVDPALTDAERKLQLNAQTAQEAAEQTEELKLQLLQLASDERIRQIEVNADINVAEIEAQAQRVEAAFGSIAETFSSTGDALSGLFAALDGATGGLRIEIEDQIRRENDRRDEALELQRELTEAEIELINAKANALQDGNPAIEIDGTGLSPHLEAFMFEVLEAVQVRVNAQGREVLLGL